MLTVLVILKVLIGVAGLSLLGQGILHVLAGNNRESNVFYRALRSITFPATWFVRLITPRRFVPDPYIGYAAFFLLAGIYIALVLQQTSMCLRDMQHPACERLMVEYQSRCEGGLIAACERLDQAGIKRGQSNLLPTGSKP